MVERLLVGEIVDEATPNGVGAAIYQLWTTYGSSPGNDVPLVVQTEPHAPAGPSGVLVGRGVIILVGYDAACTVKVTPILDINTELTPRAKTQSFAAPSKYRIAPIALRFAKNLTYIAVRVEVVNRQGRVDIMTPQLVGRVKKDGSALAMRASLP